ncbi:periplasmic heavy metal sensor [Pseudomonas vanderleydeniana]|uniref:Signaling pathway modulator ZraP n=1 Tax=Pseudomonas vanderleydeniana TaxID=2745495 RepID=A0A9E6PI41_9PSED|nr:periplasmic heavy metal sensor [Pseudomonas vanderleydeniana]QXI26491.1 periplasmic heavy metal sensor [Pseudomonas vanderleydeniana]
MTPPKYLKPLLVVSLLLNVFLVGGVAGGLYHWLANAKPAQVAINQHGLRLALQQLPEPRRKQLRQLLRQNQANSQPLVMAGREARLDVIQQLEAPTLDRNALLADLSRAREADNSLRVLVDNTLADFASSLPQDERQELGKALYPRGQGKAKIARKE